MEIVKELNESVVTAGFNSMLPCLYSYDSLDASINLSEQEVIQCLESFPTQTLEYKFAVRYPSSIVEGFSCDSNDESVLTLYLNEQDCIQNCVDINGCSVVDFDYANCESQTEYDFIDGIGCVDGYIFSSESLDPNYCSGGYRKFDMPDGGSSYVLDLFFW